MSSRIGCDSIFLVGISKFRVLYPDLKLSETFMELKDETKMEIKRKKYFDVMVIISTLLAKEN